MKYSHFFLFVITIIGCGDAKLTDTSSVSTKNFSSIKYIESLHKNHFLVQVDHVLDSVDAIRKETSLCNSKKGLTTKVSTKLIQAKWKMAMSDFHLIAPFLSSGVLSFDTVTENAVLDKLYRGGFGTSLCEVQSKLSGGSVLTDGDKRLLGFNVLEILIFKDLVSENNCLLGSDNYNRIENWLLNKSLESKTREVCALTDAVAEKLEETLIKTTLNSFLDDLQSRNLLSSAFVLQKLYDSISVFSKNTLLVKKINQPLGIDSKLCPFENSTCPFSVEHVYSDYGLQALKENFLGLQILLEGLSASDEDGGNGGLYQYLSVNNQGAVALDLKILFDKIFKMFILIEDQEMVYFDMVENINGAEQKLKCTESTFENPIVPLCALSKVTEELSKVIDIDLKAALAVSLTNIVDGDGD